MPQPSDQRQSQRTTVGVLLLGTGGLLGLSTIFAKMAAWEGVSPAAFLFWAIGFAAILLWIATSVQGLRPPMNGRILSYSVVSGALTLALPNLIAFSAVAEIGAAFVALTFAFPPMLTYAGAVALKLERPDVWRAVAVILALAGAFLLVAPGLGQTRTETNWMAMSLLIPVLLAAGNLYRSLAWPDGARPEALVPPMLSMACLLVGCCAPFLGLSLRFPSSFGALGLVALQGLAFALQYLLYFALQRAGGPVMLSLIGSVAALVAVPLSVGLLGEPLPPMLAPAAILVAAGVTILNIRRPPT